MYIYYEMVDMGLKEGQTWPSPEHKNCAQAPKVFIWV